MNAMLGTDMTNVLRLTKAGQLREATALIQRGLRGLGSRADDDRAETSTPRVSLAAPDVIDMAPPVRGGAWTARAVAEPARGSRFETRSLANAAGRRAYKLFVPSLADASRARGEPLPLVVMLHGCTQSPDDFAAGTRMNERAEELGFLVAYPEQTKQANASKCWNWFNAGEQRRDAGEPSLIADITREIMAECSVDPARVFVAGLSAGGAAAAVMAATYPDLYAGLGVHSGLACGVARDMPSAFAAMRGGGARKSVGRPVRTIIFHGSADRTVHPANAANVAAQFGTGVATTVESGRSSGGVDYTRTIEAADGRAMLETWMLQGAGHAWAGGSPDGSYTDPRGPDASREMMRFFLEN